MSHPFEAHWEVAKKILRYLKGTLHHWLHLRLAIFTDSNPIRGLYDVDWASDPEDHRSTLGVTIYFGPNLVSWWSKKQQIVARSSTKVEYKSLAQVTAKVSWIQTFFIDKHAILLSEQTYIDLSQTLIASIALYLIHVMLMHVANLSRYMLMTNYKWFSLLINLNISGCYY